MLGAAGQVEEKLRLRVHLLVLSVQQKGSNGVSDLGSARLPCPDDLEPLGLQIMAQDGELGRLPAPFNPFECDKTTFHNGPPDEGHHNGGAAKMQCRFCPAEARLSPPAPQ